MENFKEFELESPEMIFGGELVITCYVSPDGTVHKDFYDTVKERIIYFPVER